MDITLQDLAKLKLLKVNCLVIYTLIMIVDLFRWLFSWVPKSLMEKVDEPTNGKDKDGKEKDKNKNKKNPKEGASPEKGPKGEQIINLEMSGLKSPPP